MYKLVTGTENFLVLVKALGVISKEKAPSPNIVCVCQNCRTLVSPPGIHCDAQLGTSEEWLEMAENGNKEETFVVSGRQATEQHSHIKIHSI